MELVVGARFDQFAVLVEAGVIDPEPVAMHTAYGLVTDFADGADHHNARSRTTINTMINTRINRPSTGDLLTAGRRRAHR